MRSGDIRKQYIAILCGSLPDGEVIETYMRRTDASIIVRQVCDADGGGDYALTRYKILMRKNGHTLVLASPVTGRTHQLRVHFAHLGCPILGDDMYGEQSALIPRHALHALRLRLPHPQSGEDMTLSAPLPADMSQAMAEIFGEIPAELLASDFGLEKQ